MTWTYDGDPSQSRRDQVRFLAQQTSTGDGAVVSDEEVAWLLSEHGSPYLAAAAACEALANRYAGMATSRTVGEMSITYADRGKAFAERARWLRLQTGLRGVTPYAGGISVGDKATVAADTDRVAGSFAVGMDDNTGGLGTASTEG